MKVKVHNPANLPTIDYRKLQPLQGNLKDFHEREYEKLKKSLKEFGWVYPFFVWDNAKDGIKYLIDGHGRHRLATREGVQPYELPYYPIHAADLQEAKKLLLVATSQYQRITQDGFDEFTFDVDDSWLAETVNFDGIFSDVTMDVEELEAKEDEYDIPSEIKTDIVPGDLFEIGPHRLLCGDSTTIDSWGKVMGDEMADLVVTDPPYNVDYTGKTKDSLKIKGDKQSNSDFYQFLYDFYSALGAFTKAGGSWYIWHADSEGANFRKAFIDAGFKLAQCLIWQKNSMVMGRQDYHWRHEPCLYGWKLGAGHKWYSDRKQTTILEFDRPNRNGDHPKMKPVELIAYQIGNSSKDGDIVSDGFLGSGTTMVAAHQLNRKCYGLELDPKYCQVIVDRMLKLDPSLEVKRNGEPYAPKITNE